jgi:hypothetical protein
LRKLGVIFVKSHRLLLWRGRVPIQPSDDGQAVWMPFRGVVVRRGAFIGLLGGLFTGPMILLLMLIDSTVRPGQRSGEELVFLPIGMGVIYAIHGAGLGAAGGACVRANRLQSRRRCIVSGMIVMGFVGVVMAFLDFDSYLRFGNLERLSPLLIVVQDLVIPILAGIAGGGLAASLSEAA